MGEFTGKQREQYRVVVTLETQRYVEHTEEGWIPMPGDRPVTVKYLWRDTQDEAQALAWFEEVAEKLRKGK